MTAIKANLNFYINCQLGCVGLTTKNPIARSFWVPRPQRFQFWRLATPFLVFDSWALES
jgi:hypothetical protein